MDTFLYILAHNKLLSNGLAGELVTFWHSGPILACQRWQTPIQHPWRMTFFRNCRLQGRWMGFQSKVARRFENVRMCGKSVPAASGTRSQAWPTAGWESLQGRLKILSWNHGWLVNFYRFFDFQIWPVKRVGDGLLADPSTRQMDTRKDLKRCREFDCFDHFSTLPFEVHGHKLWQRWPGP